MWSEGEWQSLRELIERDPEGFLGAPSVERFGAEAPFLLKILAIDQPLSLQAHPDRTQAAAGFDRERAAGVGPDAGSYRDRRHKPELIVALEPLWMLRGLLEPAEIRRRFAEAGIASFAAETDRLASRGPDGLRDFLAAWFGVAGSARERLLDETRRAAAAARGAHLSRDQPGYWLARLSELHPADPAALAPLALHLVRLAPGEGSFQPSRILHSYLEGVGVEVMANSDNVVRAGLTAKPVDVRELLAVVDAMPTAPRLQTAVANARGAARYESKVEEFELWRLEAQTGRSRVAGVDGAARRDGDRDLHPWVGLARGAGSWRATRSRVGWRVRRASRRRAARTPRRSRRICRIDRDGGPRPMNDFLASADRWGPLLLGVALILAGRRLFWLLIATLGFLFAFTLVQRLSPEVSQPLHWVLAIAAGLIGALLAVFAQKLAVGAGGMLFGAYATLWILERYGVELGNWEWVAMLAGGILAAVLVLLVLETALVVLSSILGASLVAGATRLDGLPVVVVFAVLLLVGISVQLGSGGGAPPRRARSSAPAD